MRLENAIGLRFGGKDALEAKLGGQVVWSGSAWTPAQLFTAGQQGVWYEPKPQYLFQDAAGAVPVTADGDPMGLMLDRSRGLVLGPELITNGTFDDGLSGWTSLNDYWQWSAGRAYHPATSEFNTLLSVDISDFRGRSIEVKFDVEVLQGTIRVQFRKSDTGPSSGGGASGYPSGSATGFNSGEYRFITTLPDDASFLGFARQNVGEVSEFYVDNVSIRELPGNHARQATSAARPVFPGLAYDGVDDFLDITAVAQAATGTMSVFALIKRAVTDNVIYIAAGTTSRFTFIAQAGSTNPAGGDGMGSPIIRIDGAAKTTRGQVHDATSDLGWHLWEAEGLDVSAMSVLYIGNYASGGFKPNGDVADFIFVDESQPIDRNAVRQYLADKKGIQL